MSDLLAYRGWIVGSLQSALGVPDMKERSYCRRAWDAHFNGNGASRSRFRTVEDIGGVSLDVTLLVEELAESLLQSLTKRQVKKAFHLSLRGWQGSLGKSRDWHPDPTHLGDLILTLTFEDASSSEIILKGFGLSQVSNLM